MSDNKQLVDAIFTSEHRFAAAIERLRELSSKETKDKVYELTATLREAVELVRCLRRLVGDRTVDEVHAAFGAPGAFGYETPIGDALNRVYRGEPAPEEAT